MLGSLTSLSIDRCFDNKVDSILEDYSGAGNALTSLSISRTILSGVRVRQSIDVSHLQKCKGLASLEIKEIDGMWIDSAEIVSFPALRSLSITDMTMDGVMCTIALYSHVTDFLHKLEALGALESLTSLDISNSAFGGPPKLPSLTSLTVRGHNMHEMSWISGMTRLQSLNASDNNIFDLRGISASKFLTSLDISHQGELCDLAPLAECAALTSLDISSCGELCDLAPLLHCTALTSLNASSNKDLEELGPLACCKALEVLNLSDTKVKSVWALMSCTALTRLDLGFTQVLDLTPLKGFTALSLDIGHTPAWEELIYQVEYEARYEARRATNVTEATHEAAHEAAHEANDVVCEARRATD